MKLYKVHIRLINGDSTIKRYIQASTPTHAILQIAKEAAQWSYGEFIFSIEAEREH